MSKRDMTKNTDIVSISTNLKTSSLNFFKLWLEFLKPLHRLSGREVAVLAALLQRRFELSRTITDDDILDKVLFTDEIKKGIVGSLGISPGNFQSVLTNLRKAGVITNNTISKRYIPSLEYEEDSYRLLLNFRISYDK